MADLSRRARVRLLIWRTRLHRTRGRLASAGLVVAGLLCALGGGWLVGRWCLGLVLIAESAGAVLLGLNRDDGEPPPHRGLRTLEDVLEDARRAP